jgi:hypothetical protein
MRVQGRQGASKLDSGAIFWASRLEVPRGNDCPEDHARRADQPRVHVDLHGSRGCARCGRRQLGKRALLVARYLSRPDASLPLSGCTAGRMGAGWRRRSQVSQCFWHIYVLLQQCSLSRRSRLATKSPMACMLSCC